MDDYSMYVPNVHFEQIPIKNLVSNQDYQRSLSHTHIARAAENFDLYQINPVKVSRRDGINYVFNGQHTIEIVALPLSSSMSFFLSFLRRVLNRSAFSTRRVANNSLYRAL